MHMHGIQRRGGAGRRIFQPLLCLLLACALLSRFSSASAEYGADFDYLHTINPDIAGWLYSEDGLIDPFLWTARPARIFPTR